MVGEIKIFQCDDIGAAYFVELNYFCIGIVRIDTPFTWESELLMGSRKSCSMLCGGSLLLTTVFLITLISV